MGYQHIYAPDVDRNFYSPLYEEELTAALYRLNPTMPEDAITGIIKAKEFRECLFNTEKRCFHGLYSKWH